MDLSFFTSFKLGNVSVPVVDGRKYGQKQYAHHISHPNVQRDNLLVIVATLLLQGVCRFECKNKDYSPGDSSLRI
jgi:hypothetical protein